MVLGGQFVSRINLNLRENKGFTYGGQTSFEFRQKPGPFTLRVSVDTPATGRAIHESISEITAIRGPRPVTPDELTMGVASLTRGYARGFETADQVGRAITQLALYDLPDTYYDEFVPRIEQVSVDEVTRVAALHIDPSRLTTLVVGDFDRIASDLATLEMGAPTVLSAEAF
jgi:zinc protease